MWSRSWLHLALCTNVSIKVMAQSRYERIQMSSTLSGVGLED